MPASFKIRTVPLDENNEGFEEVLDPDFGEAAIGRVAPVDSGMYLVHHISCNKTLLLNYCYYASSFCYLNPFICCQDCGGLFC
jgi:hypothetical protein